MGVDVHDAAEGDIVVYRAPDDALALGSVVASTGCTLYAQPLFSAPLAAGEDGEWLQLLEDASREVVQLQGEVEAVLDGAEPQAAGGWRQRRADLPDGVRLCRGG